MEYDQLAAELIKSIRGTRSQVALSRRLHFKSNVLHTWETGRRWPSAAVFFQFSARAGVDVKQALTRFFRSEPQWLVATDLYEANGVARLLDDLKGTTSIASVAERSGFSRFAIARWLKAQAQPKLPDLLRLIEALSLRLLDFVAAFTDPETVPSIRERWLELQAARQAAYSLPWSHAVLRILETERYRKLGAHRPGWIARCLGLDLEQEQRCLQVLTDAGQIEYVDFRYRVLEERTIDTQQDPSAGQRLKVWWSSVALDRLSHEREGRFSYNLFTVSEEDYERLQALHLAYFRELRSIVARSSPAERVVLVNMQLLPLDAPA